MPQRPKNDAHTQIWSVRWRGGLDVIRYLPSTRVGARRRPRRRNRLSEVYAVAIPRCVLSTTRPGLDVKGRQGRGRSCREQKHHSLRHVLRCVHVSSAQLPGMKYSDEVQYLPAHNKKLKARPRLGFYWAKGIAHSFQNAPCLHFPPKHP